MNWSLYIAISVIKGILILNALKIHQCNSASCIISLGLFSRALGKDAYSITANTVPLGIIYSVSLYPSIML